MSWYEWDKLWRELDILTGYVRGRLDRLEDMIMAQFTDVQALISAMNDKTNELATDVGDCATWVQVIIDQLKVGGSAAEVQAAVTALGDVQSRLAAADDALKQIGSNPANPIP